MRVAVLMLAATVAASCASTSSTRTHELPPSAGDDKHYCGGTRRTVVVHKAVAGDAALATGGAIEVISCCNGLLVVDGEVRLAFRAGGPAASLALDEGKYRLALELEGSRRWEDNFHIAVGERLQMNVQR